MQKQPSSKMCFVCGRDTPIGLRMHFYGDADGAVYAHYTPAFEHQGYPGVMHGGLVTAMLDELIGRTAIAGDIWCMTAKIEVRFHKPVPVSEPLELKGTITRVVKRIVQGHGEIHSTTGDLLAEANGTYMRIPDEELEPYMQVLGAW